MNANLLELNEKAFIFYDCDETACLPKAQPCPFTHVLVAFYAYMVTPQPAIKKQER